MFTNKKTFTDNAKKNQEKEILSMWFTVCGWKDEVKTTIPEFIKLNNK